MDDRGYRLRSEVCSMSAQDADKIISGGDGDCALLYIYLMRRGNSPAGEICRALNMTRPRLAHAADKLKQLGLLSGGDFSPGADVMPEYTAEEIVRRSDSDDGFKAVLAECEDVLGHTLTGADTRTLFGIYDYLGLPVDVILVLLHHCAEECRRRYGPGRVPTTRQIEREAYAWVNREIMTLEQAEEYIRGQERLRSDIERLRRELGISERKLSPSERKYLESWLSLGFSVESIALAYDRTVTNTGSLKWNYMDSIIRSWHEKGLHTPEEIECGDAPRRRQSAAARPAKADSGDIERMRRIYDKLKNG